MLEGRVLDLFEDEDDVIELIEDDDLLDDVDDDLLEEDEVEEMTMISMNPSMMKTMMIWRLLSNISLSST